MSDKNNPVKLEITQDKLVDMLMHAATREDISALRAEVKEDITALRSEMRAEFKDVRGEMKDIRGEIKELRADMLKSNRWIIGVMITLSVAIVTAVLLK